MQVWRVWYLPKALCDPPKFECYAQSYWSILTSYRQYACTRTSAFQDDVAIDFWAVCLGPGDVYCRQHQPRILSAISLRTSLTSDALDVVSKTIDVVTAYHELIALKFGRVGSAVSFRYRVLGFTYPPQDGFLQLDMLYYIFIIILQVLIYIYKHFH